MYNLTKLNKYFQNARYKLSTQSGGALTALFRVVRASVTAAQSTNMLHTMRLLLPPSRGLPQEVSAVI